MKLFFLVLTLILIPSFTYAETDEDVRALMIEESLPGYSGNCPCPYNSASNGSNCGDRSAYSRQGGASPLCYEYDITDDMVNEYRNSNGYENSDAEALEDIDEDYDSSE